MSPFFIGSFAQLNQSARCLQRVQIEANVFILYMPRASAFWIAVIIVAGLVIEKYAQCAEWIYSTKI